MLLWLFEAETLLAMRSDALRVSQAKVNDDECRAQALACVSAIDTELQQRNYSHG